MEKILVINFNLGDIYGEIEGDNPCVSINKDFEGGSSGDDCGGASDILSSLLAWVSGGELPVNDSSSGYGKIYSSSITVQDLAGSGYDLSSVGAEIGEKRIEEREQTKTVHIAPDDIVDGVVDLSAKLDPIPDRILSVSISGTALDEDFNSIPGFTYHKDGTDLAVSRAAYASFSVRYLATVDVYDVQDSGDGGYSSTVYSVGACGQIDALNTSAGRCFQSQLGFPWENDPDVEVIEPPPEADPVDAYIEYDFCTKELISASPEGIVPDGSCWGGRRWPSGENCEGGE